MRNNDVCESHIPTFFLSDPKYKIVSKDKCYWCNHNKKINNQRGKTNENGNIKDK